MLWHNLAKHIWVNIVSGNDIWYSLWLISLTESVVIIEPSADHFFQSVSDKIWCRVHTFMTWSQISIELNESSISGKIYAKNAHCFYSISPIRFVAFQHLKPYSFQRIEPHGTDVLHANEPCWKWKYQNGFSQCCKHIDIVITSFRMKLFLSLFGNVTITQTARPEAIDHLHGMVFPPLLFNKTERTGLMALSSKCFASCQSGHI